MSVMGKTFHIIICYSTIQNVEWTLLNQDNVIIQSNVLSYSETKFIIINHLGIYWMWLWWPIKK